MSWKYRDFISFLKSFYLTAESAEGAEGKKREMFANPAFCCYVIQERSLVRRYLKVSISVKTELLFAPTL